MSQKFIITGNTPSKSNCYKVIRLGNRCGLGKQKSYMIMKIVFYLRCSNTIIN